MSLRRILRTRDLINELVFCHVRYGRKNIIIIGSVLAATCGVLRGLSVNYAMFLALEFFDAFFSGGVYSATFIMGKFIVFDCY